MKITPARRTTPARQHINNIFSTTKEVVRLDEILQVCQHQTSTNGVRQVKKNYKERVAISRIKLHGKFTEKMAIYDYYITELNSRQKEES